MFEREMIGGEIEVVMVATVLYGEETGIADRWDVVILVSRVLIRIKIHREMVMGGEDEVMEFWTKFLATVK